MFGYVLRDVILFGYSLHAAEENVMARTRRTDFTSVASVRHCDFNARAVVIALVVLNIFGTV